MIRGMVIVRRAMVTGLLSALLAPTAVPRAHENCTEVRFAQGLSSTTLRGTATPKSQSAIRSSPWPARLLS